MVKYSRAPWVVNDASTDADPGKLSVEADNGGYFICQVDGGMHQRANAQLIAAAPELLEALERMVLVTSWSPSRSSAIDFANQVIAKAKGLNPDQG